MTNLLFDSRNYRPFRLARSARYARDWFGGKGPGGLAPAIVLPSTRFLMRFAVSSDLDVLVFTSLRDDTAPPPAPELSVLWSNSVATEDDPRLQFVLAGADQLWRELRSVSEGAAFEWGPVQAEPERAFANSDFSFWGHKSGGIPTLTQHTGEALRGIEELTQAGFSQVLQVCFPSKTDDLPDRKYWATTRGVNWLFLNTNLHIWCRRDGDSFVFRYCLN